MPISPVILHGLFSIWVAVCTFQYEAILFHAAALVALFLDLQISELVAHTRANITSVCALYGGQAFIAIQRFKTNQHQVGTTLQLGPCSEWEL